MARRRFYTPFFPASNTTSKRSSSGTSSLKYPTHSSAAHALAAAFVAQSPSHIVVDLARDHVKDAMTALMSLKGLRNKVRSATVHANTLLTSPGRYGRIQFDLENLVYIFEKLAQLPHLTSLAIEMNYHVISLPVKVLLAVLSTKRLKKLQLKNLQILGANREEFEQLAQLAATQTQLQSLTVEACRGVGAVNALVQNLPELVDLRITSTALAVANALTRVHVVQLLRPKLRSLKLDDIPDFDDSHCKSLAQALAWPGCQLEEFTLNSPMLGDASGMALTQMLLLNASLSKFTIHIDSGRLGGWMANVISANTPTLTHLDIGLHNEKPNATKDCLAMATALASNSHLTHLRLRLEIELEKLPLEIMEAFEATVRQVPTVVLQSLSVDDGIHRYPLNPELKLQLSLNQCGVRQLLQQEVRTPHEQVNTLLATAASSNSNSSVEQIDATFTLLSNLPELIHLALDSGNLVNDNNNNINATATKTSKASATHAAKKTSVSSLLRRSFTGSMMPTPKKSKHVTPHAA